MCVSLKCLNFITLYKKGFKKAFYLSVMSTHSARLTRVSFVIIEAVLVKPRLSHGRPVGPVRLADWPDQPEVLPNWIERCDVHIGKTVGPDAHIGILLSMGGQGVVPFLTG